MIRNYLAGALTPFVGRNNELADINVRLANSDCRLLTVTGLGGSGKTRLAVEAANAVIGQFEHGVVFVGLQPLTHSDLLVPTIAQALGLTFSGKGDLQSQLFDYLHEKSLLLLLDNFEHLLDGAALVHEMLTHAPALKLLITSREALSLQEEWLYPLTGMSTPPSVYVYPTSLEAYEAVQLFLHHARRVQPNFDVVGEQEAVVRICIMTAGLPLAIELAASWLKGLSAAQIAHEIQRNLNFLSTSNRNMEERHRSMRAVFDQSWAMLSEEERKIFAKLSVFRGGFDLPAAQAAADASLTLLAGLVEKSLLQREHADRFGIHEILRQYSREKLDNYGETQTTHARLSAYFAGRMQQYEIDLQQPQQLETIQAIEADFDNIRLAWDWALSNHETVHLKGMLHGLYLFGFLSSRYRETCELFIRALDAPLSDRAFIGKLLARRWGYLHWWYLADYQEAIDGIQQALTIATDEGNRFEIAFDHMMLGYTMNSMGRYTEAMAYMETSKTGFEAIHEPYYVCWTLHRMGYFASNMNMIDMSKMYTVQSLALARETHNRVALVICLYNLGSDYILEGDYVKGKHYCEEALQVAREARHQGQIAHAMSLVGLCDFFQGDNENARHAGEESLQIIEDINMLIFKSYSITVLVMLACLDENYTEGARLQELSKNHGTNLMGYQLLYWSSAILASGMGNRSDAQFYIQELLKTTSQKANPAATLWIIPAVIYMFAETDPHLALSLVAWVKTYPSESLNWVRQWPFFNRLVNDIQRNTDDLTIDDRWAQVETLSEFDVDKLVRQHFLAVVDEAEPTTNAHLLTAREHEILHLLAEGLTNPQIADKLVIGAGTVKTHTLNIYRKLDVANRTQAIRRAQDLGLLTS